MRDDPNNGCEGDYTFVNVNAKIIGALQTRYSISSQSEKHTLFHINVDKVYTFLRHKQLKIIPFLIAYIGG